MSILITGIKSLQVRAIAASDLCFFFDLSTAELLLVLKIKSEYFLLTVYLKKYLPLFSKFITLSVSSLSGRTLESKPKIFSKWEYIVERL